MNSTNTILSCVENNIIAKNSNGFEFIETLGSFINNLKFKQGNKQCLAHEDTKNAYIWTALSAIGDKYSEIIYENAINYLDNASNIDLCKIKALQSMIQVVGLKYDVFDTFRTIPVEIANLMDILSINKSYLLNSNVFKQQFIDYLKSIGCIIESSVSVDLEGTCLSTEYANPLSSLSVSNDYIDESKYTAFLESLYRNMLTSFVYLKYADGENGLPTEHDYIYEYIQSDILASQTNASITELTPYQQKMSQLKIKYNVDKDFNQSKIVDDIENGYDSIDKYNIYEQEILKEEILYREQTYSYPKKYTLPEQNFLGFNLTRYSYYREKKVKEYFAFIDNTYNSLMIETDIVNTIAGRSTDDDTITTYNKDINYFDIDQKTHKSVLSFDPLTDQLEIQTSYIDTIARLLASQTVQIAEIRDQVKLQIRKSYMRGTFLLMSYVVNEFLRYGILDKYGSKFSTEDGVDFGTILNSSLSTTGNVELIEYYDDTEYFNITTSSDQFALYSETVNEKFWDNAYNKIGVQTEDLPLAEIENFYLKQLKLDRDNVDDVVEFLSIVYEYGANNSYIDRKTGEFTCTLRDGRWIGDPYVKISSLRDDQLSLNIIHDVIDEYIEKGYTQELDTISIQLSALSSFASSYYWNEISVANESLKESIVDEYEVKLDEAQQVDETFRETSATYENLKSDSKYRYYLQYGIAIHPYEELIQAYFPEKLSNFNLSIAKGIAWIYEALSNDLSSLYNRYCSLSSTLYKNLFALSVWQVTPTIEYWPHYSPNYSDELTNVTLDLKNFLVSQAQLQNDNAMQHLQNHYDLLITYKNEVNNVLQSCNEADAKLQAYILGVEARMGIPVSQRLDRYEEITYWSEQVDEVVAEQHIETDSDGLRYNWYEPVVKSINKYWLTEVTSFCVEAMPEGSIEDQLDNLAERTNYPYFNSQFIKNNKLRDDFFVPGYGPCTVTTEEKIWHEEFNWNDEGVPTTKYTVYDGVETVPKSYSAETAIAYDLNTATYPWHSDADADIADDILASYNNAIENLNAAIKQINTELTCLGMQSISLDEELTIDNVREQVSDCYDKLIDRINNLEKVIQKGLEPNGWPSFTSDHNLDPFRKRLQRIDEINLSSYKLSNIQYIDTTFYQIKNDLNAILTSNADYFEDYVNNDADRLDQQILAMSAYRMERDKAAKAEVSAQLCAISVDYYKQLNDFDVYIAQLKRDEVYSILDSYEYMISSVTYYNEVYTHIRNGGGNPYGPARYKDCLDYILCGNYITNPVWNEKLSGILYWIPMAENKFEDSIRVQIDAKIPTLEAYIQLTSLIYLASTQFLSRSMNDVILLTDKLDELTAQLEADITYISSQIDRYDAKKEIYLKYNGTEIGYDPFYNYKNQAYSSYQIHPYLYNFVEKSNTVYPLANTFFVMFGPDYEIGLYERSIDKILGQYGNIKDLWKSGMFDWTSYQTKYERSLNTTSLASDALNPSIAFAGLFYPPALDAYMSDPDVFIQNVQDNNISSYYYHLNLTDEQIDKIVEQLIEYEPMVRTISQRWSTIEPALSTEFDIYKYADDAYGNSLFLLKSYKYLYEQNSDISGYTPSYNEKKNAFGEVWMRIKNHPIAFPAFDLRSSYEKISQYNVLSTSNSIGKAINSYIPKINDILIERDKDCSTELSITLDTIGLSSTISKKQHLRCFVDMELDPTRRALLLVTPIYTGSSFKTKINKITLSPKMMTYANSSIILSFLDVVFDYNNNIYMYNCAIDSYKETNTAIDNISNKSMLVNVNGNIVPMNIIDQTIDSTNNGQQYSQFVGFATNGNIIYAIFAYKTTSNDAFGVYQRQKVMSKPRLKLHYAAYKCHTPLTWGDAYSDYLKYDIFSMKREPSDQDMLFNRIENYYKNPNLFKNAENIVIADGDKTMTIGFISERIQMAPNYDDNLSIVNFVEYTSMVEDKNELSTYGENIEYPRSTAMIQTTDEEKINIYNSFDSFVQHLVNVNFKLIGTSIKFNDVQYFNLNGDLGFLPQYADLVGTSRIYKNTALSGKQAYSIELLGPEKSDVPFTPVIEQTTDEKFGRVVEDYKDYNQTEGYNESQIVVPTNEKYATYTFKLSSIFPEDEWGTLTSTNDLLRYKYIVYNTKYEALPILKGDLSAITPSEDYYQGNEAYDLLSGAEIIGPNKQTYQNINLTNHINNVQDIELSIIRNEETLLPELVTMKIDVRQVVDHPQIIPAQQFRLFIYAKNNLKSYQYYHILENANDGTSFNVISGNTEYEIDFGKISSVSSYDIDGIYPFKDQSEQYRFDRMSADLEFKYSEENVIDREFPYLDASDVQDEITIVQNDNQNIYFFAIDSFDTISTINTFKMDVYDPHANDGHGKYTSHKVMPTLPKYRNFYNRALTIEATYNVERIISVDQYGISRDVGYELVEYFNYKNFTEPQYVKFEKGVGDNPPSSNVYSSTAEEIKHTWLALKPGESGRLDISVDFLEYGKLNDNDIQQSVLGMYEQNIATYYLMNVSDDKPKFIISRKPFSVEEVIDDEGNYELEDAYYAGMTFRYMMMVIKSTRGTNQLDPTYGYVGMSKIKFYNKFNEHSDDKIFNDFGNTTVTLMGGNVIEPNRPINLIKYGKGNEKTQFLASNVTFPLSILFDMKEQKFDVEEWPNWEWLNAGFSNSHLDFIPKDFYLAFSNNMKRWYIADKFNDTGYSIPTTNWQLGYSGYLSIEIGS